MRLAALLSLCLMATPVLAQTPPPPASPQAAPAQVSPPPPAPATPPAPSTSPPTTAAAPKPTPPKTTARMTPAQRFAAANTTHDGHLTKAQAEAGGMRMVSRRFADIDKDHKGYVTTDDLRAYAAQQRQARAAAKAAKASGG